MMLLLLQALVLVAQVTALTRQAPVSRSHFSLPLLPSPATTQLRATTAEMPVVSVAPLTPVVAAQAPQALSVIEERSNSCLDFSVILDALQTSTKTVLGAELCGRFSSLDAHQVRLAYAMVDQLGPQLGFLPLHSSVNVWPVVRAIEQNSSPPKKEDLAKFAFEIDQIIELHDYLTQNADKLSLFEALTEEMELPSELVDVLHLSFDDEMNLNVDKYPEIKKLRSKIDSLRGQIIQTMNALLQSQEMRDKIADSGWQDMDGRFCLMLKNTYKRGVGIVHGSSNTGRTIYVEPMAVVEPTNEMKSVIGKLREEENRIFFEMIQSIARNRMAVEGSARAVAEVDVLRAKAKLGEVLGGVIPEVGNEGTIRCSNAKHPILMLRHAEDANAARIESTMRITKDKPKKAASAVSVVGNDIDLSNESTALVISGPNAGGKTIILKTAGLFALMARHAIPIPAAAGARVDVFMDVMADIGDMQSVSGDLSTFSGHLVICREILQRARERSRIEGGVQGRCLVLLDEIGTGTDPAQGAALAQAVLEELVQLGSRLIVTTHYSRIKELAAHDERFRIAAMEFVDNRPTYRLRSGSVGESYALEAARRMDLPEGVLTRANALLDDESRRLLSLQQRLEEETELARARQREFEEKVKELGQREQAVESADAKIREQIRKLRDGETQEYLRDLKQKEAELEEIVRRARDILVSQSSNAGASAGGGAVGGDEGLSPGRLLDSLRDEVKGQRIEVQRGVAGQSVETLQADPLEPGASIEMGVWLIIMEPGSMFGSKGITTQRNKGRGRVVIRIAGVEKKMDRHLLGVPRDQGIASKLGLKFPGGAKDPGEMSAKDRRMLKMLEEELVDPDKMVTKFRKSNSNNGKLSGPGRNGANTVDLREVSALLEAQRLTTQFMKKVINGEVDAGEVIYAHHGAHNSIKDKFRGWLRNNVLVSRHNAAELSDGGDAVTVIELVTDLS
ncbi:muts domain V-domain-containing protein [Ochromonadaceae sp. CCMP2298]|nr:muts domain V-domain-containing protein [Ochromonadaceae sp. CCMP2298]|mmetsp:Transcript_11580/g.25763  ORF Transcript_11580/g.25763 Transcript_11580/m.25763 type:complete len:965 (+) Transcript_11580:117-3011(+)